MASSGLSSNFPNVSSMHSDLYADGSSESLFLLLLITSCCFLHIWGGLENYVLLVEYICSHMYVVGSPKKSAAVVGFSHKSVGRTVVRFAGQLKSSTTSCGA